MKRIRIGKDILVRWHIATNGEELSLEGEELSLEGEELRLVIEDGFGHKEEHSFEVSGNMLVFTLPGRSRSAPGHTRSPCGATTGSRGRPRWLLPLATWQAGR